ncbi:hypothetical protein DY000_02039197 [Brassica cretica]|uniref:NAC domain-containing protein n=1 Tax=Brassica cretica TaxID=69181 RepID=A0ABQ7BC76_BRACR|nr:hypothetical protein DY000_02039197 [Brassica cretica]
MGMSMLPASERGAKTSYFSSFGLIKDKANGNWWFEFGTTQKKLVSGRRICFAKALETTSNGEEKCSPHHYLVLKWDMEFFHLNKYVTMHMSNV